jgi:phosphotransferase system enzyme I (PtsP)
VCGEMAHEPKYLPFLLGIGIRTLSIDPKFLPEVQSLIKTISLTEARLHAEALLKATTVRSAFQEIEGYHAQAR